MEDWANLERGRTGIIDTMTTESMELRSDLRVLSMEKRLRSAAGGKQSYCQKVKHWQSLGFSPEEQKKRMTLSVHIGGQDANYRLLKL